MNDIFTPAPVTVVPRGLAPFLSPVERRRGSSALSLPKRRDGAGVDSQAVSHATPASPRRPAAFATLLGLIATWEERLRLRWQLAQMAESNPHLVDDIGLTQRQLDEETAKPFWRA